MTASTPEIAAALKTYADAHSHWFVISTDFEAIGALLSALPAGCGVRTINFKFEDGPIALGICCLHRDDISREALVAALGAIGSVARPRGDENSILLCNDAADRMTARLILGTLIRIGIEESN
jgi:hypothetical protein